MIGSRFGVNAYAGSGVPAVVAFDDFEVYRER
jgi:hypothetical protein